MIDKNLSHELERLGLAAKEAAVYLALIELGTVGSSKIIEATELHGQFVYQTLAKLEARGLVSHAIVRGRKKFQASHPKMLVRLAERHIRLAEDVAKSIETRLSIPAESSFETYQGEEAFIAHEQELLTRASPGCEILVIGGTGDQFQDLLGSMLGAYEHVRREKEIRVRYLGSEDQREGLKKDLANRFLFDARVLPASFTGLVNTNIWPDVVNFNTFGNPVTSFVLQSQAVAESYRSFFEGLWNIARL